jgi:uncharacterized membrane protein YkgB
MMKNSKTHLGYTIGVLGVIAILAWIGIFKFTLTEANAIKPLVANHPLMSWLYIPFSTLTVSKFIGATELIIAAGLLASLFKPKLGLIFGTLSAFTFLTTLSFLFTTPDTWKIVDGVFITDFFLFKDVVFLGISVSVIEMAIRHGALKSPRSRHTVEITP